MTAQVGKHDARTAASRAGGHWWCDPCGLPPAVTASYPAAVAAAVAHDGVEHPRARGQVAAAVAFVVVPSPVPDTPEQVCSPPTAAEARSDEDAPAEAATDLALSGALLRWVTPLGALAWAVASPPIVGGCAMLAWWATGWSAPGVFWATGAAYAAHRLVTRPVERRWLGVPRLLWGRHPLDVVVQAITVRSRAPWRRRG